MDFKSILKSCCWFLLILPVEILIGHIGNLEQLNYDFEFVFKDWKSLAMNVAITNPDER